MALQDILDAIIVEADTRIADARAAHQRNLSQLREESDRRLVKKKQDINAQREEKKRQMRLKGETAMSVHRRNALLTRKRALLDRLFGEIERQLAAQPEKIVRPFLERCLTHITGSGVIRPAQAQAMIIGALIKNRKDLTLGEPIPVSGGFLFVSEKEEHDFTFPTLIEQRLRPRTETHVAKQLFPHSA